GRLETHTHLSRFHKIAERIQPCGARVVLNTVYYPTDGVTVEGCGAHPCRHSFPTRRSSDLVARAVAVDRLGESEGGVDHQVGNVDRKSTRLNSSHLGNSYAVFCLKKNIAVAEPRA